MGTLTDVNKFTLDKGLKSKDVIHGIAKPPADYGIQYIPHKVLVGKDGNVVKNFNMNLPGDLDELLK